MAGIFTIVFSIALECGHTAASRHGDNAAFGVEPQGYGRRIDWQQGPQKPADQAADLASGPRKRFQCGGIVAGAGITGIGRLLKRFLHANRHQLRLNAMLASRNGYIAS